MVGKESEDKIKTIVSNFLKCNPEEIEYNTLIDRSTIQSSVLLHRMFADLERNNFRFENRNNIKKFGDFFDVNEVPTPSSLERVEQKENIGIDIVNIGRMPVVEDYRLDPFYNQNFTDYEISYSIRQTNPLQSFAGRFAVKEAIVKADNRFKDKNFNDFEITNDNSGKPHFENFNISISYSDDKAVAVALKNHSNFSSDDLLGLEDEIQALKNKNNIFLFILAIGIIAYFIQLFL
jgi:phosphopantetheine--protein transferase-like protein